MVFCLGVNSRRSSQTNQANWFLACSSIIFEIGRVDWQGYNDVNSEIRSTLESPSKNRFVLMNNGLTIIARDLHPTGDKFRVEDYQIVNGCQTSHVLFDQRESLDDSVTIPIRLI